MREKKEHSMLQKDRFYKTNDSWCYICDMKGPKTINYEYAFRRILDIMGTED